MNRVGPEGEKQLTEKALAGDKRAFGLLVERHQSAVYGITYRLLGSKEEAGDATQEAFFRAYGALQRFDLSRPLGPWLYRIATNVCLNLLRKKEPHGASIDEPFPDGRGRSNSLQLREPTPGPDEQLLRVESQAAVRRAILSLSPADRAVIELRHFQDQSYGEKVTAPADAVAIHDLVLRSGDAWTQSLGYIGMFCETGNELHKLPAVLKFWEVAATLQDAANRFWLLLIAEGAEDWVKR